MAKKIISATKLVIPCRISFANIFEPKSINGSEAKYSVSCLIPKDDKKTLLAIHKAVEAAKEDGKVRKWGGKLPPNLKLPLRDGDIDRPDDENYQEHFFLNATSKDAPQVVDRHVQPVVDPMMVYSGCYCNVSVNFYPFNANGNRGVAVGLGTFNSSRMVIVCPDVHLQTLTLMHWKMMRMFWAEMPVRNCRITCVKHRQFVHS